MLSKQIENQELQAISIVLDPRSSQAPVPESLKYSRLFEEVAANQAKKEQQRRARLRANSILKRASWTK
jgi:hypothetical protein